MHAHRRWSVTFAIALVTAGCYDPHIEACQLACSQPERLCPAGLSCNASGMCSAPDNMSCSSIIDGGDPPDAAGDAPSDAAMIDAPMIDAPMIDAPMIDAPMIDAP